MSKADAVTVSVRTSWTGRRVRDQHSGLFVQNQKRKLSCWDAKKIWKGEKRVQPVSDDGSCWEIIIIKQITRSPATYCLSNVGQTICCCWTCGFAWWWGVQVQLESARVGAEISLTATFVWAVCYRHQLFDSCFFQKGFCKCFTIKLKRMPRPRYCSVFCEWMIYNS